MEFQLRRASNYSSFYYVGDDDKREIFRKDVYTLKKLGIKCTIKKVSQDKTTYESNRRELSIEIDNLDQLVLFADHIACGLILEIDEEKSDIIIYDAYIE